MMQPSPPQPPAAMVAQAIPVNDPSLFQPEAALLPYALYDAVLDVPYPGASSSDPVEVIYPPATTSEGGENVDALSSEVLRAEFGEEGSYGTIPGVAKMSRFAFPEYEDTFNAKEVAQRQALLARSPQTPDGTSGANLNRHDAYLEEVYAPSASANSSQTSAVNATSTFVTGNKNNNNNWSNSLPSYHVFCHRLANGTEIHGHVRKYLPYHAQAGGRRDVGRRGVRALVILTRNSGGGNRLYSGLLKTLEILTLQSEALSQNAHAVVGSGQAENVATDASSGLEYRRWFMHSVFREHLNLCRSVATAQANNTNKQPILSKPRIITLPLVELGRGHGLFGSVDTVKFAIPSSFLSSRESNSSVYGLSRNDMLPMLRSLGVVRTLRLLSALMSERRVVFTSNNMSKLSAASYGAVAMMAQGLLAPPPVFVPVLAPGLVSLLQTQSAYLIGVLSGPTPDFISIRSQPNIGQVVVFDLDNSDETEPYYHNITDPHQFVPDLTRRNFDDMDAGNRVSLPDCLYQDLTEVLKIDKKLFWQGAVQERLGAVATKGKTAAKAAMKKGLNYFKNKTGKESMDSKADSTEDDTEEEAVQQPESSKSKSLGKGNYLYEHGFPNEIAEVEARIAFTTFFVSLFGDLRTYLTQNAPGTPPVVDKPKFMKGRAQSGDAPGTAMFLLLGHFMRSKLFDEFASARLREVQLRRSVAEDAPLFALATNYHRSHRVDFYLNNVRQSVRQIATESTRPGNYLVSWNEGIRRRTLELTSTQAFNGDPKKALTQLTEDCRESSTILVDTMMVLWTRIQEGKGLQWKKTLLALQIFRELLLNGPINAVAEAIDGFASIRILKSYTEALRGQNSALIRIAASQIYTLLVDLPVLFSRRRECVNNRWLLNNPKPSPFRKETRMVKGISRFRDVHNALRPTGTGAGAGARVAPAPPPTEDLLQYPNVGENNVQNNAQESGAVQSTTGSNDLLTVAVSQPPQQQTHADPFNMASMSNAVIENKVPPSTLPATAATVSTPATALPQTEQNLPPQVMQQQQFPGHAPQQGQQQLGYQQQQQVHPQQQMPQQQSPMRPQQMQSQYPNGIPFGSQHVQMTQQTPPTQQHQPYPPQVQHQQPLINQPYPSQLQHQQSLNSVASNIGYQQNQQSSQGMHPSMTQQQQQQQQAYSHYAPGTGQHSQNPSLSHSHSAPPNLLPGQSGPPPSANPPKKAMNFDPFA